MIAISHRREDTLPIAGRLYDRLQTDFGKGNVFMDFDSIPYGVDFREHIKQTLERAQVVVAVIGPNWFGGRAKGPRRIDEPDDSGDHREIHQVCAQGTGTPSFPEAVFAPLWF